MTSVAQARVRDMLYTRSPYAGFVPDRHPHDLQGWGSDHPILSHVVETLRPSRVLEIGSWKGRSAVTIAKALQIFSPAAELVCVDTWLGSPEHWLRQGDGWYQSLRIEHGQPQLYWTFLANIVREGLQDMVTPFPNTSENACLIFKRLGLHFQLAYLDAAHEYEPVKRDLAAVWDILTEPGVLVGDDYLLWDGVTKAVDDFAREQGIGVAGTPGKFMLLKGFDANGYA